MTTKFLKLITVVLCTSFSHITFSSAPAQVVTANIEKNVLPFSLIEHPSTMLEWIRDYKKSLLLDRIAYDVNDYELEKREPTDDQYNFIDVTIPAKKISVYVDDKVIGYVIMCPNVSNNDQYFYLTPIQGNKATIDTLFVEYAWRREGFANELLKRALNFLKESKNNEPVEIRVMAFIQEESDTLMLADLVKLYQHHGAHIIDENKKRKIVLMTFPA